MLFRFSRIALIDVSIPRYTLEPEKLPYSALLPSIYQLFPAPSCLHVGLQAAVLPRTRRRPPDSLSLIRVPAAYVSGTSHNIPISARPGPYMLLERLGQHENQHRQLFPSDQIR